MKIILFIIFVVLSASAHAERNPFVLAAGLGVGMNALDISIGSDDLETESDIGLINSFKIGGMFNKSHALYLIGQSARFNFEVDDGESYSGANNVIFGLGYTYYVKPTTGAPYVEVAAGAGSFSVDDGNLDLDSSGQVVLIGAGYEVNDHLQIGATATINNTDNDRLDDESYSIRSFGFKAEIKL